MFQMWIPAPNIFAASLEIGIILLWTFILGMMMWWIIKPKTHHDAFDVLEEIPEVKASYALQKKVEKKPLLPDAQDDLKIIVGITPKVEKLLHEQGIYTFESIVQEDVAWLEALLLQGGPSFQKYSPVTWPDQARLADHAKWTELEEYQEILTKSEKQ